MSRCHAGITDGGVVDVPKRRLAALRLDVLDEEPHWLERARALDVIAHPHDPRNDLLTALLVLRRIRRRDELERGKVWIDEGRFEIAGDAFGRLLKLLEDEGLDVSNLIHARDADHIKRTNAQVLPIRGRDTHGMVLHRRVRENVAHDGALQLALDQDCVPREERAAVVVVLRVFVAHHHRGRAHVHGPWDVRVWIRLDHREARDGHHRRVALQLHRIRRRRLAAEQRLQPLLQLTKRRFAPRNGRWWLSHSPIVLRNFTRKNLFFNH